MVKLINKLIKKILRLIFNIFIKNKHLSKIITELNSYEVYDQKEIENYKIYLLKKNHITKYRNDTLLTKEPDTISWIKNMEKNSIFWDIGANIGLYSILSALMNSSKIIAFEPSYFNLQILSKNIYKNRLQNKIIIFPLCLNDAATTELFKLRNTEEGGALSSFGDDISNSVFEYKTISTTIDEFNKNFPEYKPDYIKIDVDGIENKIINGGSKVIQNAKSVLVESNSQDDEKNIIKKMTELDFVLDKKDFKNSNLIFKKI